MRCRKNNLANHIVCQDYSDKANKRFSSDGDIDITPIDTMSAEPESAPNGDSGDARDPSGFLSEIIGAPVTVKLNSGVVYRGQS